MTKSKDPFEAAFEEQEQSPAGSPVVPDDNATQIPDVMVPANGQEDDDDYDGDGGGDGEGVDLESTIPSASSAHPVSSGAIASTSKAKEEDDEEEEENMDAELGKFSSTADPDKMAKMQEILSQFTEDQMSRYESFRRSGFQKPNMKRLLASITGSQKISVPMTIVVSGIAKMFVGELIETARVVMTERNHVGPIRPSHVREAYRRLKVEGKVPKRSVPRLFR